jgi:hypothetical protein
MLTEIEDELQEMISYRKNVTGVDHTLFISPRGYAQHSARVKVAIDPPDSLNPQCRTASISLSGDVVVGEIEPSLLQQVREFIARNREVLMDYWDYQIDTDELRQKITSTNRKD